MNTNFPKRFFSTDKKDSGDIHCLGNGGMIVYETGPDIISLQGPPYTSPSFGALRFTQAVCESERLPGQASWQHTFSDGSTMLDSIAPDYNVFVRKYDVKNPLCLQLDTPFSHFFDPHTNTITIVMPKGTVFFTSEATLTESFLLIHATGTGNFSMSENSITLHGAGALYLSAGMPDAAEAGLIRAQDENIANRSAVFFKKYLKPQPIPAIPEKAKIAFALESIAVLIKCQQAEDGGVLAGHFYPMAYVRDMSGVVRGLLAMGYYTEAKHILNFWMSRWNLYGDLHNAEGMGDFAARLYFPNDEVEIPAYVINSAFLYLHYTQDRDFVLSLMPMLLHCMRMQQRQLHGNMTGFSGDETYIAGSVFPRTLLYQGSAESTMLFIAGGKQFLAFATENGLVGNNAMISTDEFSSLQSAVAGAEADFRKNFVQDGIFYGNAPAREALFTPPTHHYGYCHTHEEFFGISSLCWLRRDLDGLYKCPACMASGKTAVLPDRTRRYPLTSVALWLPYYQLFSPAEIQMLTKPYVDDFAARGFPSSLSGGNRSLGYDYGLMLHCLTALGSPLAKDALQVMLNVLDATGAYVEYYDNGVPFNCRCRPWESALNAEAIIFYLQHLCEKS